MSENDTHSNLLRVVRPPLIGEPQCSRCKHSAPSSNGMAPSGSIECRRFPPAIIVPQPGQVLTTFPLVDPIASCGEWKARLDA